MKVNVGISNRHIHLSERDLETLFGRSHQLTPLKSLKQPGQFSAEETVSIVGPKGAIHHVRVLGPCRSHTQIEISRTDAYVLGVNPPIRDSGDLKGSETLLVQGPVGQLTNEESVILPLRHIHMSPQDAEQLGVSDKEFVSIRVPGERALLLEHVLCRVSDSYVLEFHVDTDEANAANLKNGDLVEIISAPKLHQLESYQTQRSAQVLVLNCGSSSIKYKVYAMPDELIVDSGSVSKIAEAEYDNALSELLVGLSNQSFDVICHRVVHGGEEFSGSAVINEEVERVIAKNAKFAPLHNPKNLRGIELTQQLFPGITQVACFDTAFHQTMPPSSYLYAIPYEYYENYGIRKYGFHGLSHRYVMERAEQLLETSRAKLRLLSCHIGNGVSICAIRDGKSFDTSMGLTPLAGVTMGTRSGNIDPAIIPFLEEIEGASTQAVIDILNHRSGVLGVSGVSSDLREVLAAAKVGNPRAKLAVELFTTKIHKYIGLYLARLNGADGLIFTAGVGENSVELRELICSGLEYAGVVLDRDSNCQGHGERLISAQYSPLKVMVIPTNEELIAARDGYQLLLDFLVKAA